MATGLANQFVAATTTSFQQKVAIALVTVARQVKTESTAGQSSNKTLKRQSFADRVLQAPGSSSSTSWMPSDVTVTVAYALASLGQDDTTAENTIVTSVTNAFDALAGVYPWE